MSKRRISTTGMRIFKKSSTSISHSSESSGQRRRNSPALERSDNRKLQEQMLNILNDYFPEEVTQSRISEPNAVVRPISQDMIPRETNEIIDLLSEATLQLLYSVHKILNTDLNQTSIESYNRLRESFLSDKESVTYRLQLLSHL